MARKKPQKFVAVANLLNLNVQDVVNYVAKLHQHIVKQNKKINKLRLKIRKMKFLSKLDQHIAKTANQSESSNDKNGESKKHEHKTEDSVITDKDSKHELKTDAETEQKENVLDFVNEIKAQATINSYKQAGFIYEPTSGLYYDTKSGYYYNPQYDLYYNGNDGNWYRLNPRTHEFIFHSGTEKAVAKKEEIDEDEAIRRILEDNRKPSKSQDSSSKSEEKVEKKSRGRSRSVSSSDSDDSRRHKKKKKHRSRSRSRSRSRRSHSRSRRSRSRSRSKRRHSKKRRQRDRSRSSNRESGELDTSDGSGSEHREVIQEKFKRKRKKKGNEYEEIAKKYPPSLRLMVIESDKMDVGKLFVVTYKGGSLGREGSHHDVLISDVNVSKNHLKFFYNHKINAYQFVDSSRNGTLLDGVQISSLDQKESNPHTLNHGSTLKLSKTTLLCHIHEGLTTCSNCEPYNYVKKTQEEPKSLEEPQPSNLSHKEGLKLLQKRYGLQTEKYQENPSGTKNKNYEDRAEKRRVKVGSSHHSVKTVQASVETSISSENKGFKLLSKMGWSEGTSIGKSQEGIKEPVLHIGQQGTSGLGSDVVQHAVTFQGKKKHAIWNKTQERYNNIKKPDGNIFDDADD